MAKEDKEKKEGGGIVSAVIVLVIVFVWLAIFAALIKFDVGGFGSDILYPVLKDVPIVNKILPDVQEDDSQGVNNNGKYTTLAQAIARINELENILASQGSNTAANADYIEQLEQEVSNLKVYRDSQEAFEQRVLAFDNEVVFGNNSPDIEEYKKYYEEISPENAEKIYAQVVEQYQYDARVKAQADTYGKMEPADAARILSGMTAGDLDLVAGILSGMSSSKSSLILAEMEAETAAQITKKMTYTN
ncbi:MAG: hypothetical protein HFH14_08165 [Lachnospiraceae bacterium]|nr:hypothetical protein [Lachnospiraceae bacterium]